MTEGPRVEFIASARVAVRFEPGFVVDDIEVSPLFPGDLQGDEFRGRQIEVRRGEHLGKPADVLLPQKHHKVGVVRQRSQHLLADLT